MVTINIYLSRLILCEIFNDLISFVLIRVSEVGEK